MNMRWLRSLSSVGLAVLITESAVMAGDEVKAIHPQPVACVKKDLPAAKTDSNKNLVYIPPKRGSPEGRVAGGTRGPREFPRLIALAPDHRGLTIQERPALYWVLPNTTKYPITLTVINADTSTVVVEKSLPPPTRPGVQTIRLDQYDIRLVMGVPYRWLVTVGSESEGEYVFAGGVMERVAPSASLSVKLQQACPSELPAIYLAEGVWYDALQSLVELIDETPHDVALRQQYAALLEQVGLTEAARYGDIPRIGK